MKAALKLAFLPREGVLCARPRQYDFFSGALLRRRQKPKMIFWA